MAQKNRVDQLDSVILSLFSLRGTQGQLSNRLLSITSTLNTKNVKSLIKSLTSLIKLKFNKSLIKFQLKLITFVRQCGSYLLNE